MNRINLRLILTIALITVFSIGVNAQAKWSFNSKKVNDSVCDLQLKVQLPSGWHIYSQKTKGTELPIVFTFQKNKNYSRMGGVKEPRPHSECDKYAKDTAR